MFDNEQKKEIVAKFGKTEKDSGSVEVQIALLTERVKNLTEHMLKNKRDFSALRGLKKAISRRTSLLKYLSKDDHESYSKIVGELDLK